MLTIEYTRGSSFIRAIVGEKKWHEFMAKAVEPFTPSDVRYFPVANLDGAEKWCTE